MVQQIHSFIYNFESEFTDFITFLGLNKTGAQAIFVPQIFYKIYNDCY